MAESMDAIRNFLLQTEKTLKTRKLYASDAPPYREACERLHDNFRHAVSEEGFTIRFGSADLFVGKESVLTREKREESFFFPLYRDGLRELNFSTGVTLEELDQLLTAFEAERKGLLSPSQDTVSFLWRLDLSNITFQAIDGIGDQEGDDESPTTTADDYQALVADLMSKIRNPVGETSTGQTYSFVLDADSRIAASDLQYEGTTKRRAFEDNPTVLRLTSEEAQAIRDEVAKESDEDLLERFIEVLFISLMDPSGALSGPKLTPVFGQLLEGFWKATDYSHVTSLLERLHASSQVAPIPESREEARKIMQAFLTVERVRDESFELVREGKLPLLKAFTLWDLAGDAIWDLLVDFWWSLPKGEARSAVGTHLQKRLSTKPDLLRGTLSAEDPEWVRAGLALIGEGLEGLYAKELFTLACHPEESIRLKVVPLVGQIGDGEGLEVLWKLMENDAAKPVRLLAFRIISSSNLPQLPARLKTIINHPGFGARPVWEQEKYVRLLGAVAGESVQPLFESWIPKKRWLWQARDHVLAQLAVSGLAACGGRGLDKVRSLADGKGNLAEIARKALRNPPSTCRRVKTVTPPKVEGTEKGR